MPNQYPTPEEGVQASDQVSKTLAHDLELFLLPLLIWLDRLIDKRLVRTLLKTVACILEFRQRANGLLLSELGAYILSPAQAAAGTKRLSNLLRSQKWTAQIIEEFFWQQADTRVQELAQRGEDSLFIWDESVLEKPESLKAEGLCAVRSSKARRLTRIKPGYYTPPRGPIFVPGLNWLAVLLAGREGPPSLVALQWWTTRGPLQAHKREVEESLVLRCARAWGGRVLHVFDRGFAGGPWLERCKRLALRFVVRWPKDYHLLDEAAHKRKAWHITRGKRSWAERQVWDGRRQQWYQAGVLAVPVSHPQHGMGLWLVVSRPGKGRPPWYLLTNEPIRCEQDAWRVVFASARRWQIELCWRVNKSELAFESPRLWSWEGRVKLLLMAALAYAFLLTLLDPAHEHLRVWLLRWWCHRTGKRSQAASTPLYRLRWAISRLWLAFDPALAFSFPQNSG
jgi:hypothetical protein